MPIFADDAFDYLCPEGTARYTLSQVRSTSKAPPITLLVKHAGESNERYQNALVKAPVLGAEDAKRQGLTLFARYVIVGWENVLDLEGKALPYTPEGGEELLLKLVDKRARRGDIVARLISFANNADNFRDEVVDAGDLGNE